MIYTVSVTLPPPDEREIRRYAGCPTGADDVLRDCIGELCDKLTYRVCYAEFDARQADGVLDLGFAKTESKDLEKVLAGCDRVLLFASTVGLAPDRLIKKYSRLSPTKTLFMQAIGSERVEALCDAFCAAKSAEYGADGYWLTPRFSAGYGDLPLSLQHDIFAALDVTRNLGIILNDSLLMMPSKSVTAIAGIRRK